MRPKLPPDMTQFRGIINPDAGWNSTDTSSVAGGVDPAVSGAAPAGGGATPSGGNVNFDPVALMNQDPLWRQQQMDLSAQGIQTAAQRAANIRQTLINWGIIPDAGAGAGMGLSSDVLGYLQSDVDANTAALAKQNTEQGLSISARLDKNNTDNIRNIRNALAARGMYSSGELGHGLTENAQNYKVARTDAEKQVLGTIGEAVGQFQNAQSEIARQRSEYLMAAAQRAADLAGSAGSGSAGGNGAVTGPYSSSHTGADLGPNVVWDPSTNTPWAPAGLPAGLYDVKGPDGVVVTWKYDPSIGWLRAGANTNGTARPYAGTGNVHKYV